MWGDDRHSGVAGRPRAPRRATRPTWPLPPPAAGHRPARGPCCGRTRPRPRSPVPARAPAAPTQAAGAHGSCSRPLADGRTRRSRAHPGTPWPPRSWRRWRAGAGTTTSRAGAAGRPRPGHHRPGRHIAAIGRRTGHRNPPGRGRCCAPLHRAGARQRAGLDTTDARPNRWTSGRAAGAAGPDGRPWPTAASQLCAGRSAWATWPRACTPASVRPATVSCGASARRRTVPSASSSVCWTVRRPGWRAHPEKPDPS